MDDSKSFLCKHNIGLSIKLKNYKVPHNVISVPLDEKQKRGKPVKNKGRWSKEYFFYQNCNNRFTSESKVEKAM